MGCAYSCSAVPPGSPKHVVFEEELTGSELLTFRSVNKIFDEYCKNVAQDSSRTGSASTGSASSEPNTKRDNAPDTKRDNAPKGRMEREELRKIFADIDSTLFDLLWSIFDREGSGFVEAEEFVMVMALLSSEDVGDGEEAQLEAAFGMFDKMGQINREEFETMVDPTFYQNLNHLLESEAGQQSTRRQLRHDLQKEFSDQNPHNALRESAPSTAARMARAKELHAVYVKRVTALCYACACATCAWRCMQACYTC